MKKVIVAMSGGIDSSVSAYLLKEQGYEVEGVTMTLFDSSNPDKYSGKGCFTSSFKADLEMCRQICEKLSIRHTSLDISELYEREVIQNFKSEYLSGHTPNPCIICNEKIKFGAMVEYAREAGIEFDYFATGHYARIVHNNQRFAVAKAVDSHKDQSYFLYRLGQKRLSEILFPLGELTKREVRDIDISLNLHPQDFGESMDFYSGEYTKLLNMDDKKGQIVDTVGNILGSHNGYWNYTIGQRKGLGIGYSEPLYVVAIDPDKNQVKVGTKKDALISKVEAENCVFMALEDFDPTRTYYAKVRSASAYYPCNVIRENEKIIANFQQPIGIVPLSQSLVVYDGDVIVAGGIITSVR